jgi:agarase
MSVGSKIERFSLQLRALGFLMAAASTVPSMMATDTARDTYGGWKEIQGTKTGFFHTEKIAGKWWIISPEGNGFLSKGVNSVHPPHQSAFTPEGCDRTAVMLNAWGMNTAGCWSDPALAGKGVSVALRCKITGAHQNGFPDVFDPAWKISVLKEAASECSIHRNNPWILGYFTDNELPWKHDDKADEFVEEFLKLPQGSPGRTAAEEAKRSGIAAMKAFREKVADLYFRTTAEAIRTADPNHMILGCRFAGRPPMGVVAKMSGQADVISINNYSNLPPLPLLREMSRVAQLPVMVTEFSFKAPAPGLETNGSGPVKPTQAERAHAFTEYAPMLLGEEYCVGYHWFKYAENWQGVLQADGSPWPELTEAFSRVNATAEGRHR